MYEYQRQDKHDEYSPSAIFIVAGLAMCVEETTRGAGLMFIIGGLLPKAINKIIGCDKSYSRK